MANQYFAAGNTGSGFVNCFEYINEAKKDGFLYILKGGAGTGKSTLMKKIGRHFEDAGNAVEYFYCSSDPESLDGVRLSKQNIAIVDGTAPHITEAKMPNVSDKIINLGDFIGTGVKSHNNKIQKLNKLKKDSFEDMYAYIFAAASINSVSTKILSRITDRKKIEQTANEIYDSLDCLSDKKYKRKLFISAISVEGKIDFVAKNNYKNIITLSGNNYAAQEILEALSKKLDTCTLFCDILCPDAIEAIEVGDTLICTNAKNTAKNDGTSMLEVELFDTISTSIYNDSFANCHNAIDNMLKLASDSLKKAKASHKQIEEFYYPFMDFKGLDKMTQSLINEIKAT